MQTGNAAVALRIGSGSALKVEVEADVQHDSDGGGRRGGQTDHSQARIGLDAHEVGHGQAYQQGLHQTLHHDPDSLVVAVEITHHAEQHSSGDGLWREAFQIGESVCEHGAAKGEADANAGEHGLSGTFFAACTDILRDKRCHRLHQCAGDQHGKVDDLAGHTVTGRCFQPKTVDEGAECKERELGQKLLQSQRQTDAEEFAALGIQAEISLAKLAGCS